MWQRPCIAASGRQLLRIGCRLESAALPLSTDPAMVLQLPPELWDSVADFAHSDLLSQVCRQLRDVLGGMRYVKLTCDSYQTVERVAGLVENVRSLQLKVRGRLGPWDPADAAAVLQTAPHLHTLALDNMETDMGVHGAQVRPRTTGEAAPPPPTPRCLPLCSLLPPADPPSPPPPPTPPVEHPNQEGDTCIDWTSQYCWTNGWNCLRRGDSVYQNRPLIPPHPLCVLPSPCGQIWNGMGGFSSRGGGLEQPSGLTPPYKKGAQLTGPPRYYRD